ncbi:MAG: hypothetical protein ACN6N0_01520, partial [Microvirgula sp.]
RERLALMPGRYWWRRHGSLLAAVMLLGVLVWVNVAWAGEGASHARGRAAVAGVVTTGKPLAAGCWQIWSFRAGPAAFWRRIGRGRRA